MFIKHLPGLRDCSRYSSIYMEKYLFESSIKLIKESSQITRMQDKVQEP